MVYTVTFNPALDYIIEMEKLKIGKINKSKKEIILPGGKGINVSIVLSNLGIPNISLGFKAGFTGNKIEAELKKLGVKTDFIDVKKGISRINVKIIEEDRIGNLDEQETAINGNGPKITNENIDELYKKIGKIKEDDFLVLSGSISNSLPNDIYEDICKKIVNKKINIVADATGKLLVNVLKYKPFLVKPNEEELAEIFGIDINSEEEIIYYAKKLHKIGARNVLVSRGENGGILITEGEEILNVQAPKGKRINTVGAGDSMVAGFIAGYIKYENYEEAFKMGLASGSASACSENLATKEEIINMYKEI